MQESQVLTVLQNKDNTSKIWPGPGLKICERDSSSCSSPEPRF